MHKSLHLRLLKKLREISPKYHGETIRWWRAGEVPILDVLKYIGVPPTEIAAARNNGKWVFPNYRCKGGEHLVFIPVRRMRADAFSANAEYCWKKPFVKQPTFICDVHLGKLARNLRMLGYDVDYGEQKSDQEIETESNRTGCVVLSRDRNLLMRSGISHGQWLINDEPDRQVVEVLRRWGALGDIQAFSRCLSCNTMLQKISISVVQDLVPEDVKERQAEVWQCPTCEKVFWQGSHYEAMSRQIKHWLDQAFGAGS